MGNHNSNAPANAYTAPVCKLSKPSYFLEIPPPSARRPMRRNTPWRRDTPASVPCLDRASARRTPLPGRDDNSRGNASSGRSRTDCTASWRIRGPILRHPPRNCRRCVVSNPSTANRSGIPTGACRADNAPEMVYLCTLLCGMSRSPVLGTTCANRYQHMMRSTGMTWFTSGRWGTRTMHPCSNALVFSRPCANASHLDGSAAICAKRRMCSLPAAFFSAAVPSGKCSPANSQRSNTSFGIALRDLAGEVHPG